jgi:hypothetical protein
VRRLLAVRRESIVPLLPSIGGRAGTVRRMGELGIAVEWRLDDGRRLRLQANLGPTPVDGLAPPAGVRLWPDRAIADLATGRLPPWTVLVHLVPRKEDQNASR